MGDNELEILEVRAATIGIWFIQLLAFLFCRNPSDKYYPRNLFTWLLMGCFFNLMYTLLFDQDIVLHFILYLFRGILLFFIIQRAVFKNLSFCRVFLPAILFLSFLHLCQIADHAGDFFAEGSLGCKLWAFFRRREVENVAAICFPLFLIRLQGIRVQIISVCIFLLLIWLTGVLQVVQTNLYSPTHVPDLISEDFFYSIGLLITQTVFCLKSRKEYNQSLLNSAERTNPELCADKIAHDVQMRLRANRGLANSRKRRKVQRTPSYHTESHIDIDKRKKILEKNKLRDNNQLRVKIRQKKLVDHPLDRIHNIKKEIEGTSLKEVMLNDVQYSSPNENIEESIQQKSENNFPSTKVDKQNCHNDPTRSRSSSPNKNQNQSHIPRSRSVVKNNERSSPSSKSRLAFSPAIDKNRNLIASHGRRANVFDKNKSILQRKQLRKQVLSKASNVENYPLTQKLVLKLDDLGSDDDTETEIDSQNSEKLINGPTRNTPPVPKYKSKRGNRRSPYDSESRSSSRFHNSSRSSHRMRNSNSTSVGGNRTVSSSVGGNRTVSSSGHRSPSSNSLHRSSNSHPMASRSRPNFNERLLNPRRVAAHNHAVISVVEHLIYTNGDIPNAYRRH